MSTLHPCHTDCTASPHSPAPLSAPAAGTAQGPFPMRPRGVAATPLHHPPSQAVLPPAGCARFGPGTSSPQSVDCGSYSLPVSALEGTASSHTAKKPSCPRLSWGSPGQTRQQDGPPSACWAPLGQADSMPTVGPVPQEPLPAAQGSGKAPHPRPFTSVFPHTEAGALERPPGSSSRARATRGSPPSDWVDPRWEGTALLLPCLPGNHTSCWVHTSMLTAVLPHGRARGGALQASQQS